MRDVVPAQREQLRPRIAEDLQQFLIELQPLAGDGRNHRHPHKRQVEEPLQTPFLLRVQRRPVRATDLAEVQEHRRPHAHETQRGGEAHPQRHLPRPAHGLDLVDFGHEHPVRPLHRPIRRKHPRAAVIDASHGVGTTRLERTRGREVRGVDPQACRSIDPLPKPQVGQKDDLITLLPRHQGLAALALRRPPADGGQQCPLGREVQNDRRERCVIGRRGHQRHHHVQVRVPGGIVDKRRHLHLGRGQQRCHPGQDRRRRHVATADLDQRAPIQADKRDRIIRIDADQVFKPGGHLGDGLRVVRGHHPCHIRGEPGAPHQHIAVPTTLA